ncbi:MAG: hypothetical protein FJZ00_02760 [Candidatus Sericytochromatia bacterium]|uniref:Uncharacterized protein n=1 Tax=Candidatus Tanganyikabacteria bacterium TaxID=2961651 RepID=A0A937X2F3_9BACT|nr:hypothetical protein [Candidatus Tanganyikabacteria bacterium]
MTPLTRRDQDAPILKSYRPDAVAKAEARRWSRRRRWAITLTALGVVSASLAAGVPLWASAARNGATAVNTAHLDGLLVPVLGKRSVWASAWQPGKGKKGAPAADPETGLLSRTEDVARIASFYLDLTESHADDVDRMRARQAVEWLLALAASDGRFSYGLDTSGNASGPTVFDWPGARAFWALAQAARTLPKTDKLRNEALAAARRSRDYLARQPDGLVERSAAVTAACVLGLAELQRAVAESRTAELLGQKARAVAKTSHGEAGVFPFHAHMPTANPALWHAYGAYQMAALVEAGQVLGNREWLQSAEKEAASWSVHLLISGGPIWGFAPAPRKYPQIPYNLEPQVRGLLALYRATGKDSYGRLAGLFGAWLIGDNPAGKPVYDSKTGRVADGLDPSGLSRSAGAEAAVLGLSTLQQLGRHPEFSWYLTAKETGAKHAFAARTTPVARTVRGSGPYQGAAFVLMEAGKRIEFAVGGEGPHFISPIYLRGLGAPGTSAALELRLGTWSQRYPLPDPADPAVGPVLEVGRLAEPVELKAHSRAAVQLGAGSTLPVAVDGMLVQPVVEYRAWQLGRGKVAVVKSLSPLMLPLQYAWPGAGVMTYSGGGRQVRAGEDLEPYGFALIESGS